MVLTRIKHAISDIMNCRGELSLPEQGSKQTVILHSFMQIILTMPSNLVNVVLVLIVVGVVLWLINRFIPMAYAIKQILNVVVVIAVIIWLLKAFGLLSRIHL